MVVGEQTSSWQRKFTKAEKPAAATSATVDSPLKFIQQSSLQSSSSSSLRLRASNKQIAGEAMGNGAKAEQRRARNAQDAKKGPTSQLKSNEAAKSIKCKVCFQTFLSTAKPPELTQHSTNKHNKTYEQCFV